MQAKRGFTLVEILIVVVILGILAAIVIPQFTEASSDAKLSSLCSDLQTIRSQIELYKVQHNNDAIPLPETGGATWDRLTQKTTIDGVVDNTNGSLGPYLQQIPKNPFSPVTIATNVDVDGTLGDDSAGWYLNSTTGNFRADNSGSSNEGIAFSAY